MRAYLVIYVYFYIAYKKALKPTPNLIDLFVLVMAVISQPLSLFYLFATEVLLVAFCAAQDNETALLIQLKTGFSGKSAGESQGALKCCGVATDSWGETGNYCMWNGVTCDSEGFVAEIAVSWTCEIGFGGACLCKKCVSENHLNATALASLQHLRSLSLRNMGIDTPLPLQELSRLSNLKHLDLAGNAFKGCMSSDLGRLTRLEHLDLYGNRLTCDIPHSIGDLGVLEYLDLTQNQMDGSIPYSIGNLKSLKHLSFSGNKLQGILPPSLGNLSLLETLSLSNNEITGSIPPLGGLVSLKYLFLNQNKLNGTIPPSLGNLIQLEDLDLSDNQLNGTIPSSLGGLVSLRKISLSYNQLQGSFPQSLGQLGLLESLNASSNKLQGSIPSFLGNMSSLQSLDLSSNNWDGTFSLSNLANLSRLTDLLLSNNEALYVDTDKPSWIPSFQLTKLILSSCNLRINSGFPQFLSTQGNLMTLDLSNTGLPGNVPPWLFNITKNRGLRLFYLQNNSFDGTLIIPTVVHDLRYLDLSNNLISNIPINIGGLLPNLWYLNLSANALSGYIPSSIGNLKYIGILDMSYNKFHGGIPSSIAMGMANLATLRLTNNKLSGLIFPNGSNLLGLESLHLGGNEFEGTIPKELLKSPILKVLDVGRNGLDGDIPVWLSSMSTLRILILKENGFHGSIPRSLCNLRGLAILDLSNNRLEGSIPPCFNNVTAWVEEKQIPHIYGLKVIFNYIEEVGFGFKEHKYSYMGVILSLMNGIDLSMNQLDGHVPEEMGDLAGLVALNLSGNQLSGTIPRSFKGLHQIQSLDLSNNKFSGEIPHELASLSFLAVFSVARNNLSGSIPQDGQLFSFDQTSYSGNPNLCGPPLKVNCTIGIEEGPRHKKGASWKDYEFYVSTFLGFMIGFWSFIGVLFFNGHLKQSYYEAVDGLIERVARICQ